MDQFGCKLGQSLNPPARKSIFDVDVRPLDVAEITQPLTEGVDFRRRSGRAKMQETNTRDLRWLLRICCERPRRRAPESTKKFPSPHVGIVPAKIGTLEG